MDIKINENYHKNILTPPLVGTVCFGSHFLLCREHGNGHGVFKILLEEWG